MRGLLATVVSVALLCWSGIGAIGDGPFVGGGGGNGGPGGGGIGGGPVITPKPGGGPFVGGGGNNGPSDPKPEQCDLKVCMSQHQQQEFFKQSDCDPNDDCCNGDTGEPCRNVTDPASNADRGTLAPEVKVQKAPTRKRRSADLEVQLREKRGIQLPPEPESGKFPDSWWRCDFTSLKCCRTCRRTVPLLDGWYDPVVGYYVWPVYCIHNHGVQLVDEIACLPQYCESESKYPCRVEWTYYTYLVTPYKPHPYPDGHCYFSYLPVFFSHPKVRTHCVCDENGKYKAPKKGGGKGKKGGKKKGGRRRG